MFVLSIGPSPINLGLGSFKATYQVLQLNNLQQISSFINQVLYVDSHTILGSRSRFVWLCVQVNHDEHLKTFMKIAKYAQLNFYKGIGSMCFMYGRLGYKKE